MSTTAISSLSSSSAATATNFYQNRKQDLTVLGDALKSGNLNLAQAAFSAASGLANPDAATTGPFSDNQKTLETDFQAVGAALKNGDLTTAQKAGQTLSDAIESGFYKNRSQDLTTLGNALQSGNLSLAQDTFSAANSLKNPEAGSSGPFSNKTLEADFQAVGAALQAGNLAGAQAAGLTLYNAIKAGGVPPDVVLQATPTTAAEDEVAPSTASQSINLQV